MDALKRKLDAALARRDAVERNRQRVQGRLDNARRTLEEVEGECRNRKVDPDRLDEAIQKLTQRYEDEVASLVAQVAQAEKELAPYLEEEMQ
jgi:chromosome segregation ATPase